MIDPVVDVLADLADGGPVLELAIGTGRIAVPLAARGVQVSGIELSKAMAARIVGKPGSEHIDVTIGDMTSARVPGDFSLVYLVFNTIANVTTQDGQVDVFRNAAAHLRPGGLFLVEVGIPDLRRMPPGQDTVPFTVAPDAGGGYIGFDRYDVATQLFTSNHVTVTPDGGRFRADPLPLRVARRDGSHGAYRGPAAQASLGGLGPGPVRAREHQAGLGLGEGLTARPVGSVGEPA